jgi:hypothetical protein
LNYVARSAVATGGRAPRTRRQEQREEHGTDDAAYDEVQVRYTLELRGDEVTFGLSARQTGRRSRALDSMSRGG